MVRHSQIYDQLLETQQLRTREEQQSLEIKELKQQLKACGQELKECTDQLKERTNQLDACQQQLSACNELLSVYKEQLAKYKLGGEPWREWNNRREEHPCQEPDNHQECNPCQEPNNHQDGDKRKSAARKREECLVAQRALDPLMDFMNPLCILDDLQRHSRKLEE